ncbi:MAG: helix-turn-helix domain-containing protein [Paludibacteraceae bacterium]|nr:helix-turn-helix domain-containing protein [Paludibacteraceae bacterium]
MATIRYQKTCAICGQPFTPRTVTSLYCSDKCSQSAYRKKKAEQKKAEQLKAIADAVPDERPFISIPEAIAIYGVSKSTLYRLIRLGQIPAINLGTRLLRISREEIEKMFTARQQPQAAKEKPAAKVYSLEPEDCYSIGEIAKKFGISESTVYSHIRKNSIPTRQIGRFVYAPKSEINKLYTGKNSSL